MADAPCNTVWQTTIATGATVALASVEGAHGVTYSPSDQMVYAVSPNSDVIDQINPATKAVTQPFTLPGGQGGYAIAADASYLWVSALSGSSAQGCSRLACTDIVRIALVGGATQVFAPPAGYSSETGTGQIVDAANYLYTSAWGDAAIERISKTDGSISFVAGNPYAVINTSNDDGVTGFAGGYANGTASNAWFNSIVGVASDGTNLWVGDNKNNRLREVVAGTQSTAQSASDTAPLNIGTGDVSTFAGSGQDATVDGTGTAASFSVGGAVTVAGGSVYVATNGAIRKVNPSTGAVSTFVGSGVLGCSPGPNPASVEIGDPSSMDTDGTYLYVADPSCFTIWKISLATGSTAPLTLDGTWQGVTYGPDGYLYATYAGGISVSRIDPASGATTQPYTLGGLSTAIASDGTSLWVGEQNNDTGGICRATTAGCTDLVHIVLATGATTTFTPPEGVSMTWFNQLVSTGQYLYSWTPGGSQLQQVAKSNGAITELAGQPYPTEGWVDGIGLAAQFRGIDAYDGIATDGTSLWVFDGSNYRLRRIVAAPTGSALTAAELLTGSNSALFCSCRSGTGASTNFTNSPVDAQTGDFWHTFTDLSIPGRGPALNFERTYNSDPSALATPSLFGPGWSFSYGMTLTGVGSGGVVTVTQENGSTATFNQSGTTFTPTSPDIIATLVATAGDTYTFTRHDQIAVVFNSSGQLISETDPNGYITTINHTNPNALVITDPAGRALTATIANGEITELSDDSTPARTVKYGYDSNGNLTSVTDVNNGVTQFGYDGSHRMTTMRSPRYYGDTTTSPTPVVTNDYDSSGRVDWQTDQLDRKTSFDYTSVPGSTEVTDPKGNVTQESFLGGLLVSVTKGYGTTSAATTTFGYDPATGGISEVTDPDGRHSFMYYDSQGNVLTSVDNAGNVTSTTYNNLDEPLTVTEPAVNGVAAVTTTCYDNAGNVLSVTKPDPVASCANPTPAETVFDHYGGPTGLAGDVTSVTDQGGYTTTFTYDSVGDVASSTLPPTAENPAGDKTTYSYDTTKGWLTSMVSPKGNVTGANPASYTTTYAHDPRGPVTTVSDPLGDQTVTHYDADGNVDYTIDADHNKTTYTYDPAEELTATVEPSTPTATTVKTDYWPDGTVKDQIDGLGGDTAYTYDPLGRVATVTDPDNRATSYSYDAAGNELSEQDPGGNCTASPAVGCTTYSYTVDNQLAGVAYSDGTTPNITQITYDADGQRTSMSQAGIGTSSWGYDTLGRLTSSQDSNGAIVGYGYDTRSDLNQITYPGGDSVTRDFDPAGRMDWVQDWTANKATFGYDPNSNETTQTVPAAPASPPNPAVTDTFGYDDANNLTSISDQQAANPTPLVSFNYTNDAADQVKTVAATGESATATNSYGYTALQQLSTVAEPAGTNSYDPAGNPTGLSSGVTQSFDPANQICWAITATVSNPTCAQAPGGATMFGYNSRGDLTTVAAPAGTSATLNYDQANRLTAVSADTGTNFHPVAPARIADTISGSGEPYAGDTLGPAGTLTVQVTGASGDQVPADATAVVISLTAATSTTTFLTVYPNGASRPGTSALNVASGGQLADNQVTAKIGAGGQIVVYNQAGDANIVVDVMGYYLALSAGGAGFVPVTPARLVDTRNGSGYQDAGEHLSAGSTIVVQVAGYGGVPAGATAAIVDLTAVNDTPAGYLVGYADGSTLPGTASLTYNSGVVTTKEAVVALSASGTMDITNGVADTDVTVDVEGYYIDGTGNQFTATTPTRIADTRAGSGEPYAGQTIGAGKSLTVQVSGANGDNVPAGAVAAVLNVTEVNATAAGRFTVYPTGAAVPATTTVAFPAGSNMGDEVTVALSAAGQVNVYNLNGTTDAVVDVEGYFAPATQTNDTYTYDGDGLRMTKTVNGTTQKMVWDQADPTPLLLSDGTNDYIYGPGGQPLEQVNIATGAVWWLHHDQQGSTIAITDTKGDLVGTATYSPWGQTTATSGDTTPLGYNGQYTDAETGLIYLRARYYVPQTGQFLTRDPADAWTRSTYGYVEDNPLNGTDPTGLWSLNPISDIKQAASDTGSFVYNHAGTLSTITSALATVAYVGCAVSEGLGCGLGFALSATSTLLSGVNTYHACYGGAGHCTSAVIGLGISALATVAGGVAQYGLAQAVSGMPNSYAQAIYLARQAGVIGGVANGISTFYGLLTSHLFDEAWAAGDPCAQVAS